MAPLIRKKRAQRPPAAPQGLPVDEITTAEQSSVLKIKDNPFLRQSKESKKEKRQIKKEGLHEKIRLGPAGNSGISKSALRRRKRKATSQLSANLTDILSTLPEEPAAAPQGFVKPKAPRPMNPHKSSKSNEKVIREESTRFNRVLGEPEFRKSPFAALRNFINASIDKKPEFADKASKVSSA